MAKEDLERRLLFFLSDFSLFLRGWYGGVGWRVGGRKRQLKRASWELDKWVNIN